MYPNGVDRCRQGSAPCHLLPAATNIDIHQLVDLKGDMRLRSGLIGLLLAATNVHDCLAANNARSSALFLPRKASTERWELIPRGGAVSLDPKTVATAGLSCLAAHCAFDILAPSTMVEFYGLDKYQRINSFYFPRIGGWGLAVVGSLLLQLYSTVPFIKAIGYSFLPITIITVCQLLAGQYEQVSYDVLPEQQSWVTLSYVCVCLFVGWYQSKQWYCSCRPSRYSFRSLLPGGETTSAGGKGMDPLLHGIDGPLGLEFDHLGADGSRDWSINDCPSPNARYRDLFPRRHDLVATR